MRKTLRSLVAGALVVALSASLFSAQASIPYLTGPLDPSGTLGTLNSLITSINSALATPTPSTCGATCTISGTVTSSTVLLGTASGSVATLPAATGSNHAYKFIVTTTVTSNSDKVLVASTSDKLQGIAFTEDSATVTGYASLISTGNHSIAMNGGTTGGFQGDSCTFTDIATNVWQVRCDTQSSGTAATPFSTSST